MAVDQLFAVFGFTPEDELTWIKAPYRLVCGADGRWTLFRGHRELGHGFDDRALRVLIETFM